MIDNYFKKLDYKFNLWCENKDIYDFNDLDIKYIYDTSKNQYVDNLPNNTKIIFKRKFNLELITPIFNLFNKQLFFSKQKCLFKIHNTESYKSREYYINIGKKSISKRCKCEIDCNCFQYDSTCDSGLNFCKISFLKKYSDYIANFKNSTDIIIIIDNYFNIYLPLIKTYFLINNNIFPEYLYYIT